jgi:hypothetical protein
MRGHFGGVGPVCPSLNTARQRQEYDSAPTAQTRISSPLWALKKVGITSFCPQKLPCAEHAHHAAQVTVR